MDPLSQAMQMLQEAQQVMAMQAEEIQNLRSQLQNNNSGMQKKASTTNLAILTGYRESDLPDFVKNASESEIHRFVNMIEGRVKSSSLGKVAEITDFSSSLGSPAESLEENLARIISL